MSFYVRPKNEGEDISLWAQEQFESLINLVRREQLTILYFAEPLNPEEGLIVRADGTEWNPGSGAGFYGRHNGAWRFLG